MTLNLTPSALIDAMLRSDYFSLNATPIDYPPFDSDDSPSFDTLTALDTYATDPFQLHRDPDFDPRPLRDRLADALSDDIHDLLANANLDAIIPDDLMPDDDDSYDALADAIRNLELLDLADALIARAS